MRSASLPSTDSGGPVRSAYYGSFYFWFTPPDFRVG